MERVPTCTKPKPIFYFIFDFTKDKGFSILLSSRNNLCKQKNTHSEQSSGCVFFICGGAKGTRTPDLCVANASLYQLSYNPTGRVTIKLPRFTQPLLPTDYKTRRFYVSRCRPQKFLPHEAVKILVEVGRIELPSDTNRRDFLQV